MVKMKAETLALQNSKVKKLGNVWLKKCTVGKSMAGMLGKCMWEKHCYKIHKEYCWENTITESWAT